MMGCSPFHRSCSGNPTNPQAVAPNPDPSRWKLLKQKRVNGWLIVKLKYLDCTNFEGEKILVFRFDRTFKDLCFLNGDRIDPHFGPASGPFGSAMSPFARFEPTDLGWKAALAFCEL
jgi:hypothetical protein